MKKEEVKIKELEDKITHLHGVLNNELDEINIAFKSINEYIQSTYQTMVDLVNTVNILTSTIEHIQTENLIEDEDYASSPLPSCEFPKNDEDVKNLYS